MDLELDGKIALITGASGGIGRATAKLLAREGVQTIVVARGEPQILELASEIEAEGRPRPMVLVEDLNQRDSFARVRDRVLERFGHVDILVNNLGQGRPLSWDSPDSAWDEAFALNFTPPRKLAEAFIPAMRERKFGRIVNLTATLEPPNVSGSMTSKAAVQVWSKGLSRVLGRDGITVNCVSPGIVMTDQIRRVLPRWLPTKEDQNKWLEQEVPMRRFGEPDDVARLICVLCSPLADYITGQRIYVDGGWNRHI